MVEPPVWLPRASGTMPAATAAAEPLEEPPPGAAFPRGPRLAGSVLRIEKRPRLDPPIGLSDSVKAGLDELLRRDHAVPNQLRRIRRRQHIQAVQVHRRFSSSA